MSSLSFVLQENHEGGVSRRAVQVTPVKSKPHRSISMGMGKLSSELEQKTKK